MDAPNEMPATKTPAPAQDPLKDLEQVMGQIRTSARNVALAVVDAMRIRIRSAILRLVLLALVALLGAIATVVGVILLMIGAAHGLATLLRMPIWGGYLAVGVITLGALAAGGFMARRAMDRRWFDATRARIAARHAADEERT